jgi:NAD(P)-dependent dehydrogenase (short-subunit alcohol dehydrogenase family)
MTGTANPFSGGVALVTGAGDGIGAMLARGFARWGMRVCVQDIRRDAAEAVCAEIGNGAFPLVFDISDREASLAAANELKAYGEPLRLIWANAGAGLAGSLLSGKPNTIEWGFTVNVLGAIWTAQAFVPLLAEEGARHVGFTASSASLRPPPAHLPLYPVTKHCAFAVADALKAELAEKGIDSTILFPGLLNTNIWNGARARPERYGGPRETDPAINTMWREAKSPDLMWPHVERIVLEGGGYLTCETQHGAHEAIATRAEQLSASIVEI